MAERQSNTSARPSHVSKDYSYLQPVVIKKKIQECLTHSTPGGNFSMSAQSPQFDNPGLYVKDVGPIGLPLSDRDAKALIAACHQAPYGKGADTIIDLNVRKTWELNADRIELRNPAWQSQLKKILKSVAEKLGVDTIDNTQLYKMLLYEEGAMFKAHRDSEKAPGMFGTLVICLPSLHSGGQVIIKHGDKTSVLDTSEQSAYGMTYMAWYSDVLHQIEPVISGYRLVLTYNLIKVEPNGAVPRALDLDDTSGRVHDYYRALINNIHTQQQSSPPMLAYKLDHKYTDGSLAFGALKGDDRKLMSKIQSISGELGDWCVYLANIERTVVDYGAEDEPCEYYYGGGGGGHRDPKKFAPWNRDACEENSDDESNDDDESSSYESGDFDDMIEDNVVLTIIVDSQRLVLGTNMTIDRACLVQKDMFDEEPDDQNEEYTGNEGNTSTYWYRSTCALLMPTSSTIPFFLERPSLHVGSGDSENQQKLAGTWLDQSSLAYTECPSHHTDQKEGLRKTLTAICRAIVNTNASRFSVRAAYKASPTYRQDKVAVALEAALALSDSALFLDLLGCGIQLFPEHGLIQVAKGFQQFETKAVGDRTFPECEQWAHAALYTSLSNCSMTIESDGIALVDTMAFGIGCEDWTFVLANITAALKKPTTTTPAIITYLEQIYSMHQDKIGRPLADEIFKTIVSALIRHIDLKMCVAETNKRPYPYDSMSDVMNTSLAQRRAGHSLKGVPAASSEPGTRLCFLIEKCFDLGLYEEVEQLESAIMKSACSIPKTCQPSRISLYERLFRNILQLFVNRYVKAEPRMTKDWTRLRCRCGCPDCAQLNSFLVSATQKEWRFQAGQTRRSHIEHQTYSTTCKRETMKKGSPHTLILTKGPGEAEAALAEWKERCVVARYELAILDGARLKELLVDHYESIMSLKVVEDSARPVARGVLTPISHNVAAAEGLPPLKLDSKPQHTAGAASNEIKVCEDVIVID